MANETAITAAEYATWLTPLDAFWIAANALGKTNAGALVFERLRGGMIRTAGRSSSTAYGNDAPTPNPNLGQIPIGHWAHFAPLKGGANFWETGDARFFFRANARGRESYVIRCFGVRLNPTDFLATLPPTTAKRDPAPATQTTAPSEMAPSPISKGGRPRKDWWGDLWIEMARRLYDGELKPKKQVEIENAMAEWLSANGHEAGEATVRRAARRLFAAITRDQN